MSEPRRSCVLKHSMYINLQDPPDIRQPRQLVNSPGHGVWHADARGRLHAGASKQHSWRELMCRNLNVYTMSVTNKSRTVSSGSMTNTGTS